MKRFIINAACFCILLAALAAAFILVVLPAIDLDLSSFDYWSKKIASLSSVDDGRPRMVLVGGSNLAYGVDNQLLEDELGGGFKVINLGLNAGIGVGLQFDLIDDALRDGDVIVYAGEYMMLGDGWNGALPVLVYRCDVMRRNLLTAHRGGLWSDYPTGAVRRYVREKLYKLIGRSSEGANGGTVLENGMEERLFRLAAPTVEYVQRPVPQATDYRLSREIGARLMAIDKAYSQRGVRLLISAPTYDKRQYLLESSAIEKMYEDLESQFGLTVISCPRMYSFPLEEMLNTEWHVNTIGRARRTKRLAQDIKRYIP